MSSSHQEQPIRRRFETVELESRHRKTGLSLNLVQNPAGLCTVALVAGYTEKCVSSSLHFCLRQDHLKVYSWSVCMYTMRWREGPQVLLPRC